jgi:subtilisin-like proprotein convertase family protein
VHNEQGGGTQNLILTSKDFSSAFKGIYPNGNWMLRVQDRLRGDVATVKQVLLEIGVEGSPDPVPAP